MNLSDFEQNGGIEFWSGKLKKQNCKKLRKFSEFLIETEKQQNGNYKRKIETNRERFLILSKMAELSNKAEILKKKIETKRQISDFDK